MSKKKEIKKKYIPLREDLEADEEENPRIKEVFQRREIFLKSEGELTEEDLKFISEPEKKDQ